MSNTLALAAVTATLRDVLARVRDPLPRDPNPDADLNETECTTRPPDRARLNEEANQVNVFLYQTAVNAQLRNVDMPGRVQPGETGMSPLALNLYYLVTAYGRSYDDLLAQRVLGRAMSLLHDGAVLLPADIAAALPGSDLSNQIERVRITPHPMSTEELSKLWATFQTPYRLSTAYRVSLVLIDSNRATRAPLPVLAPKLGPRDDRRGSQASVIPPYPTLESVTLPLVNQPSARLGQSVVGLDLGDVISFGGHDLGGTAVNVTFAHRLTTPAAIAASGVTPAGFSVQLPDNQVDWPAGLYSASAEIDGATTNAMPLAIAPRLIDGLPASIARVGTVATIPVRFSPQVWPEQSASLLVGTREVMAAARTAKTDSLSFDVDGLDAGTYFVRIRVDGVDSHVIRYQAGAPPSEFDTNMEVTIT